jgi:glycerol-3-phosphate dehydrogenase subunit C
MTITYDPSNPAYWDEADMRDELLRVYDLCHGCRLCFNLCPSFPTLFEYADAYDGDVHQMAVAEQDLVVDECFQCKICYVKCPYIPPHEWQLDFPRLLLRNAAVRKKQAGVRVKITDNVLGRTDLNGKVGTRVAGVVNKVMGTPNTGVRRLVEKATGISAQKVLPPFARQRFSSWFATRSAPRMTRRQGDVALFQTCMVEYQAPDIGKDLVKVYERNGIGCSLPDGTACCGAPFLHAGDFDNFKKVAEKNVKALAAEVRKGRDIVVPQPTCGYVLKKDYFDHVGDTDDTRLVKEHTFDAAEYLMKVHKAEGTELDTEFTGAVPETITYHVPCHLQAQNIGLKSRDLMKLTGAKIQIAAQCSGIDGTWGYRAENQELQQKQIQPLKATIEKQAAECVVGDCHLANGAIAEETGRTPLHPFQVVARAYGIPEETS